MTQHSKTHDVAAPTETLLTAEQMIEISAIATRMTTIVLDDVITPGIGAVKTTG